MSSSFGLASREVAYQPFLNWPGSMLPGESGVLFSPNDPANRLPD